jgi:hypothetical protein
MLALKTTFDTPTMALPSPPPITPSAPHVFTEGQGITVEGIQGPYAYLNGTYWVDSVNPGTTTP